MGGKKAPVRAMPKGKMAEALAAATELKRKDCMKVINSLTEMGTKEVKRTGKFTLPKVCRFVSRTKPATKAGERMMFGKTVAVKAKPAQTVVKAFCLTALRQSV